MGVAFIWGVATNQWDTVFTNVIGDVITEAKL